MQSTESASLPRLVAACLWVLFLLVAGLGLPLTPMYIASSLLGALVLYLFAKPSLPERLEVVVLAALFLVADELLWRHRLGWPQLLECWSALGIATWAVVGARAIVLPAGERRTELFQMVLVPSAAMMALLYASQNFINTMGMLRPKTLDLYTFSFDGSLGFQPSFIVGRLFHQLWWFRWLGAGVYFSILLAMCIAYAAHLRAPGTRRFFMLELFFLAAFLGYVCYNIFPVAGPSYIFDRDFPWTTLSYAQCRRLLAEPYPLFWGIKRNAMPSLHMTWALQIWWNMRRVSRGAFGLALFYAVFTAVGTLGTGEHYLVDLAVAFPFALMVQGICTRALPWSSVMRRSCVLGGFAAVAVWLVLLRFANRLFWLSPAIPWLLILLSVGLSLVAIRHLEWRHTPGVTEGAS